MYLIVTASSDAYIQNKILQNSFRTTDGNTGLAGTLDLFKLYGETSLPTNESAGAASAFALDNDSNGTPETAIELSRIFVKFDYDRLDSIKSKSLDVRDASFKAFLTMKTISAGQFTPKNFTVDVMPLAQSFDEGIGRDVISFGDLDACNFVTASFSGDTVNLWNTAGAGAIGTLGGNNLDAYNLADFGAGNVSVVSSQTFSEGNEDLRVDVTRVVAAAVQGQIPNHGFRIAFTANEETDTKTRFVKRFASRHSKNPYLRPSLHIIYDDTILDNTENSVFDHQNTLYFQNYLRGSEADLKIGATTFNGTDCLKLVVSSGSFSLETNVSSVNKNTTDTNRPGLYKGTFTVNSNDETVIRTGPGYTDKVKDFAIKSGSLPLTTEWKLNDGSLTVYTGSVTLKQTDRYQGNFTSRTPDLVLTNLADSYRQYDLARIRIFGRDVSSEYKEDYGSIPQRRRSVIYDEVYYKIVDALSGDVAIPENKAQNGTRVSTDSGGMFFDLDMSNLHAGRNYYFVFCIVERGTETVLSLKEITFKVVR